MKKIFLGIIIVFLFIPMLQDNFNLFDDERPLKGSFTTTQKTPFYMRKWAEGDFQANQEKYINDNFGFRKLLVRIYNEYRYRLFKLSTNKEAIFGKDDVFFAEAYIDSYVGKDYIGHDAVISKSKAVKRLQDTLAKMNITFIPVFAPNKARFYSDKIPDCYFPKKMSNYEDLSKSFTELGVKHIDFNKAFEKVIHTSQYPLFSQYGIHWSTYAHTWATDSIIKYVRKERNVETPTLLWKNNIEWSDSLRDLDYDIGAAMNLLTLQLPSAKMAYPKCSFTDKEKTKPSLLVIGDSFYFGIESTGAPTEVFSDHKFLYYFEELRSPYNPDKAAIYKLDLLEEIKKHDVIILICTEHGLDTYGWGFIERANGLLNNELTPEQKDEFLLKAKEIEIRQNPEWMKQIEGKAWEKGISIDEMIKLDAKYIIDLERQEQKK
ncbi:MAG TPA: hypothetical protein VGF30_00940 [Bacteroidia bacterium]